MALLLSPVIALFAATAIAAEGCPAGTHEVETESGCARCVDDQREDAGLLRFADGDAAYEVAFAGEQVLRVERSFEGEPPTLQIADLRTGSRESMVLCGSTLKMPAPSPAGLRWVDATGKLVLIQQLWGLGLRNMRTLYAMPDGTYDVVGARRYPAPGAHMRGHWTDGYYHRRTLGPWRVTLENGSVERGQWARGEPAGLWTVVAPDGRIVERGRYLRGYPNGVWTCGTDNGGASSGRYRLGKRVGDWVTVDAAGAVVSAVAHHAEDAGTTLRGRHWRGGMLSGAAVKSPCDPQPDSVLTTTPSDALPPGMVRLRITDESGLGVPGVLVILDGDEQMLMTDAEGEVRLGPLAPGLHELTAQKVGFSMLNGRFSLDAGAASGVELTAEMLFGR